MTTTNSQDFKSYYPRIKNLSVSSERYEKYYCNRLAAQQANQQTNKRADDCDGWFPLNQDFGVTEK